MQLLVRNRVADYETWMAVVRRDEEARRAAGLEVLEVWRCVDQPNNVFFLLSVADRAGAEAFMATPEAAQAGRDAGVIDGEYYFVTGVRS